MINQKLKMYERNALKPNTIFRSAMKTSYD